MQAFPEPSYHWAYMGIFHVQAVLTQMGLGETFIPDLHREASASAHRVAEPPPHGGSAPPQRSYVFGFVEPRFFPNTKKQEVKILNRKYLWSIIKTKKSKIGITLTRTHPVTQRRRNEEATADQKWVRWAGTQGEKGV